MLFTLRLIKKFDILDKKGVSMEIKVNREINEEKNLIITITVKEPFCVPLSVEQIDSIKLMEDFIENSWKYQACEKFQTLISTSLHNVKEKIFGETIEKLKFNIENDFHPRYKHICQEIYNWIYDHQHGLVRKWMQEFDPQRTKYYFNNDKTIESDFTEM